jgi:ribosome-associated translation inhibitor RaiA
MLDRAHELATYFATEAAAPKIATAICRYQAKTEAHKYQQQSAG